MKTAELQSSRNKSSWKWSSSEDGAAGAAQLQEKAQSRGEPEHEGQEPKDTVLGRAAEGAMAPMAQGNLGYSPALSGGREAPCHTPIPPPRPCSQSSHTAIGHRTAGQAAHMGRVTDQLHTLGTGRELPPPPSFSMEPVSALGQRDGALAV